MAYTGAWAFAPSSLAVDLTRSAFSSTDLPFDLLVNCTTRVFATPLSKIHHFRGGIQAISFKRKAAPNDVSMGAPSVIRPATVFHPNSSINVASGHAIALPKQLNTTRTGYVTETKRKSFFYLRPKKEVLHDRKKKTKNNIVPFIHFRINFVPTGSLNGIGFRITRTAALNMTWTI